MDQKFKIRPYTPDSSSYAPRISNEQWNQHKSLLKHLHDQGYKRAAMLEILREHNFFPSTGQLNAKMSAWGFKVYGTQADSQEQEIDASQPPSLFGTAGTENPDWVDDDPTPSPNRSLSSLTLYESELPWSMQSDEPNLTLDQTIILQSVTLIGSYQPSVKPSDFGFKVPSTAPANDGFDCQSIVSVADFLSAIHSFEQAFDLYYYVFEHLITRTITSDNLIVQGLVRCAASATTVEQCTYAVQILRRAYPYCIEHALPELAACFESLLKDLEGGGILGSDLTKASQSSFPTDMRLLIAMNPKIQNPRRGKDMLKQQLLACDSSCATLTHLSSWCQDTLSFFRPLQSQLIGRFSPLSGSDISADPLAFEMDFQVYAGALIIDYLNSPGPSIKKANAECKDNGCLFRWALSPTTSLIVMTHLLYEPLQLQSQATSNPYLHARAQNFAVTQTTTALEELKAFAFLDADTRCDAFIDLLMKHLNTSLAFRRTVSRVNCNWDKLAAATRLAQLLLSNQTGLLPHAGLPSARRSVLKNMASPFGHDPSLTESRPSAVSESGSMGEFERFAAQLSLAEAGTGFLTPSDAMSIDARSSWSFHRVTGLPYGHSSARNSISSRRGDQDPMEEYHQFMRDSNAARQQDMAQPDTPTPNHQGRRMKKP